jgi:predicted HicB family RNase H-like nuclease
MEFPWLCRDGPTASDAIAAVQERVDELVEKMEGMLARDDELPPSLTERHYSGKFVVRTSTALHARLTVEAIEQGVSLNQWVVQKLSGGRPESDDF